VFEQTNALGSIELVSYKSQQINSKLRNVDFHFSKTLGSIRVEPNPTFTGRDETKAFILSLDYR